MCSHQSQNVTKDSQRLLFPKKRGMGVRTNTVKGRVKQPLWVIVAAHAIALGILAVIFVLVKVVADLIGQTP